MFAVTSTDGGHPSVRRPRGTDALDVARSQRARIFGNPETMKTNSLVIRSNVLRVTRTWKRISLLKGTRQTIDYRWIKNQGQGMIESCNLSSMLQKSWRTVGREAIDRRPVASDLRTLFTVVLISLEDTQEMIEIIRCTVEPTYF